MEVPSKFGVDSKPLVKGSDIETKHQLASRLSEYSVSLRAEDTGRDGGHNPCLCIVLSSFPLSLGFPGQAMSWVSDATCLLVAQHRYLTFARVMPHSHAATIEHGRKYPTLVWAPVQRDELLEVPERRC